MIVSRGRGGGNRTHVRGFGDPRPTIERRPYGIDRDYTGMTKNENDRLTAKSWADTRLTPTNQFPSASISF